MKIISTSANQTKEIGRLLAQQLHGGEIICLSGDLGSGKTTFTQGLLKELGVKGPYTSPTFTIVKEYIGRKTCDTENISGDTVKKTTGKVLLDQHSMIHIYHIDAYRITSKDLLELGFADFAGNKDCLVIIEWPEKVKKIIPPDALWIKLKWIDEKEREIAFDTKNKNR